MFHGVTARPGKTVRHMNTHDFVKLLQLIRSEFEVVALDTLIAGRNTTHARPRVALTFDDGYLNNFTEACPVLAEMQLPATFFLITDSLTNDQFTLPIDTIDCIIEHFSPAEIVLDTIAFRRKDGAYFNTAGLNIFDYIIDQSHRMNDFLAQLNNAFPFDFLNDPYYATRVRYVDKNTLAAGARNPLFTFASHTQTHINCAKFEEQALRVQLSASKKQIEEITGAACSAIAYPYGLYNETARRLTAACGYQYAYSVNHRLAQDAGDDSIVQRIGISNTTTPEVNLLHLSKLFAERAI
jgi:peptidoglycan/xylan/chitin deacetylase (PgdA/CDA1 family)